MKIRDDQFDVGLREKRERIGQRCRGLQLNVGKRNVPKIRPHDLYADRVIFEQQDPHGRPKRRCALQVVPPPPCIVAGSYLPEFWHVGRMNRYPPMPRTPVCKRASDVRLGPSACEREIGVRARNSQRFNGQRRGDRPGYGAASLPLPSQRSRFREPRTLLDRLQDVPQHHAQRLPACDQQRRPRPIELASGSSCEKPPELRNARPAVGAALQFLLKLRQRRTRGDGGADRGLGDFEAGADGGVEGGGRGVGRAAEEVFEGGEGLGIGITRSGEVEAEEDLGAFDQ